MAKWKGKKVSRKRLFDLKTHAETKRLYEHFKYGFAYQRKFTIGGNKNSKSNHIS